MGNQRLIEHDCDLSGADDAWIERITGKLTAFETNSFYTYAAIDLTAAYPSRVVRKMERRLLFINDGVLCVLDRVKAARQRTSTTWHLQLPARLQLAGGDSTASAPVGSGMASGVRDIRTARQIHGLTEQAGIWELGRDAPWAVVTQQGGRLFVRTLLPSDARRLVIGGPMAARQIPAGPSIGRTYYGGESGGYEHRLAPAVLAHGLNAAYALKEPTGLGENFGVGATWGRLDVTPADDAHEVMFLHLLVPVDAEVQQPPNVQFAERDGIGLVAFTVNRRSVHVELALKDGPPGRVVIRDLLTDATLFDKALAIEVQPNLPIPGGDAGGASATSRTDVDKRPRSACFADAQSSTSTGETPVPCRLKWVLK